MPPSPGAAAQFPEPFVVRTAHTLSLHFTLAEVQSRMDLRDPPALCLEYTRLMMGLLLFVPAPRRLAVLGLGGGSLVRFCHAHLPACALTAVELNPQVIALRDRFLLPPDSARLRVVAGDAAAFVRESIRQVPRSYTATLTVQAPAERVRETARWFGGTVEELDDARCTLTLRGDSIGWLGACVGLVEADYTLHEPPELAAWLDAFAERVGRARYSA